MKSKMKQEVYPVSRLEGIISVAADKSISHRAFMLSALANGSSYIHHPLLADDVKRTILAFQKMGIDIVEDRSDRFKVIGKGLYGLQRPQDVIDVGNSGTTIRLLLGILSAQSFSSTVTGDSSIVRRPMSRVIEPLKLMGAHISGRNENNLAPLSVQGTKLQGVTYRLPIASAQVKSAILLAGLYAEGTTTVIETMKTRDHTELMLQSFGVPVSSHGDQVSITQQHNLTPAEIHVPGDISSAAFYIAAALMIPSSEIILQNVGINPTRTGFLEALELMGAKVEILEQNNWGKEPVAVLRIQHQSLSGAVIEGELIPRLIDEIPILAVLATQAEGVTEIRNAEELRVKESDRIAVIASELRKMNAEIEELPDGLRIKGKTRLQGAELYAHHDHRIALSLYIAAMTATGKTVIEGFDAIKISYPEFLDDLQSLIP